LPALPHPAPLLALEGRLGIWVKEDESSASSWWIWGEAEGEFWFESRMLLFLSWLVAGLELLPPLAAPPPLPPLSFLFPDRGGGALGDGMRNWLIWQVWLGDALTDEVMGRGSQKVMLASASSFFLKPIHPLLDTLVNLKELRLSKYLCSISEFYLNYLLKPSDWHSAPLSPSLLKFCVSISSLAAGNYGPRWTNSFQKFHLESLDMPPSSIYASYSSFRENGIRLSIIPHPGSISNSALTTSSQCWTGGQGTDLASEGLSWRGSLEWLRNDPIALWNLSRWVTVGATDASSPLSLYPEQLSSL